MADNSVQYQRGLPMLEFFESYGTQEQCETAVNVSYRGIAKNEALV